MWSAYRKFVVDQIIQESATAKSFHLKPLDSLPLAPYLPGQHLPLRLTIPGQVEPVYRFYTLSDCHNQQDYYRLTIKKELPPLNKPHLPSGLSSGYFHDVLRVGDTIEAKSPGGNFFLDVKTDHPVVFIAGGIGVTPLLAMVNAATLQQSKRKIWLFFALRGRQDHAFKDHLRLIARDHPNIRIYTAYERPEPTDVLGTDYHREGRLDIPLLTSILPTLQLEYYICGPAPMMQAIVNGLLTSDVPAERIKTESFGPAGYRHQAEQVPIASLAISNSATVTFKKSGKTLPWDPKSKSLWHFAEKNEVEIGSGCLYGDCGTCMTRLLTGQVAYMHKTVAVADPGSCLPCSCKPSSSIVLDA